jgi:thioredoxin-related protein
MINIKCTVTQLTEAHLLKLFALNECGFCCKVKKALKMDPPPIPEI